MDLSIVLVNWNSYELVEQCLATIERSGTRCPYEVVICDNASTDGSQERLRALERARSYVRCVYATENLGFGAGNNHALPHCRGRYVLFLNSDTLLLEPLDALIAAAEALGARCGALGGRVLNVDKTLQVSCREAYTLPVLIAGLTLAFAGVRAPWVRRQELDAWDHASARAVAMVSGCYLLVPASVLAAVGGFDPALFHFFEDTDLCYRIRAAGYVVEYVPAASIIHLGGGSTRASGLSAGTLMASVASARYFTRKYMGRWHAAVLAAVVWVCWLVMWCAAAPLGLLLPRRGPRTTLRRRARLVRQALLGLPRQRVPHPA